jgi:hypothetical protein
MAMRMGRIERELGELLESERGGGRARADAEPPLP